MTDSCELREGWPVKVILAGLMAALLSAGAAAAVEYRTPVVKQPFTCLRGVSRVVAMETQAPCCESKLHCAEFLATTGVIRPMRDPRT